MMASSLAEYEKDLAEYNPDTDYQAIFLNLSKIQADKKARTRKDSN